jgi:hypothetical protein
MPSKSEREKMEGGRIKVDIRKMDVGSCRFSDFHTSYFKLLISYLASCLSLLVS